MKKRLYAFILTLCLVLSCFQGFSVMALDTVTEESVVTSAPEESVATGNTYNKLHFYFDTAAHATIDSAAELQTATASVKADFAAAKSMSARSGEAADENVYITVQFASDYLEDETYLELKADRENAKTAQQRDTAKSRLNAYSKSYHQALVAESLPLLSALPYTHVNAIDYSSFVTLTVPACALNTETLAAIAENENILHISLTDGFEVVGESEANNTESTTTSVSDWDDVLECIGVADIVAEKDDQGNRIYSGSGLKIGIYEASTDRATGYPSMCDSANSNLVALGDRLHFRYSQQEECPNYICLTHSTKVTSVLALILPDAEFYFTFVPTEDENGGANVEGVSWFIEMGCDVVNCSFGTGSTGYRYDIDAVYDYLTYCNDIVVVKSAGNIENSSDTYITSPGYAHNVITVGGVGYSSTVDGWIYHQGSKYSSPSGIIKPDIAAPRQYYVENIGSVNGTSYAAPLVTASIALYHQYFYRNIGSNVSALMARSVTIAAATKTEDYENTCNLDDRVGAGIVNLEAMMQAGFDMFSLQGGATYRNITLSSGDMVQIALVWLHEPMYDAGLQIYGGDASDYNLALQDPFGNTVATSTYTNNSVEYIRYTATTQGRYRIVIMENETMTTTTQFSLSTYK